MVSEHDRRPLYFDAERKANVGRLVEVLGQILDEATVLDGEPACDVMVAIVVRAIGLSKQLAIDDNEFFDMVVKMYEWTHVETVESH
jgi:hypothetical protein